MKVMIVDDHDVVRQGLKALFEADDSIEVVAEAGSVADAVSRARIFEPDVIVMDVRLPDGSGIEACRDIRSEQPDIRVVMLTSYSDDQALFDSILAGADGYLLKQVRSADLVESVRRVGNGESILDPVVTARVLERVRNPEGANDPRLAKLSPTELRILQLIADGHTNKEIADTVHLAEKTVKNYVSSILSKLDVSRRAEAAAYLAAQQAREERRY